MSSRRSTYSGSQSVSYAAVGSTQAPDVFVFPPKNFTTSQKEFRIGSGQERFDTASAALMTWGVVSGSHLELLSVDQDDSEGYAGVKYNEFGAPVSSQAGYEHLYAPDGTEYLSAGTSVVVSGLWSPKKIENSYRVIYVIREDKRTGYAWGTIDSYPIIGEELFMVELRDDDSVWCVVRCVISISVGQRQKWQIPLVKLRHYLQLRQYVRSLLPARTA